MHTKRLIVRMYRKSDVLYSIPDEPNTLTRQSTGTNDAPGELLQTPMKFITCSKI